jgi:hypothetical protein
MYPCEYVGITCAEFRWFSLVRFCCDDRERLDYIPTGSYVLTHNDVTAPLCLERKEETKEEGRK